MCDNKFIKIIGVGNGGCNIVNNMFKEGNLDVLFTVCNTDKKALKDSPVTNKLFLEWDNDKSDQVIERHKVTENIIELFRHLFDEETRMVFITAGMGGATGTTIAPIIARICKGMGILTVGVVTTPFLFEGDTKINLALSGVKDMAKNTDSLFVINNELMRKSGPDEFILNTISKADDALKLAAQSITDIIAQQGLINLDFEDVKSVLYDGGITIISTGYGEGEGRMDKALCDVQNSPQLKNVDLVKAKKMLLNISFSGQSDNSLMMEEMNCINDFMSRLEAVEMKWGISVSPNLNDKVKISILATGFKIEDVINDRIYANNHNSFTSSKDNIGDNQIFISYKRFDKDKVFEIKDKIEDRIGNHCWIDLNGIESDAQFANVIINAINQAKVFLFMYSSSHALIDDYDNDWTVREINFAQKKRKRIVFVNIDGTPLTDWFELMFGTKQQVDANSDVAMQKLCKDLTKWINAK